MIRFELGGTRYEYDDTMMTVKEARVIKEHTKMGLRSWALGLQDMDVDALVGLVFIAKRRAGEAIRWQDLDTLNLNDINMIEGEGDADGTDTEGDDVAPPEQTAPRSSTRGKTQSKS